MVRVQVQLTAAQHRRIRQRARRLGLSVAEVVRRCLDADHQSHAADSRESRVQRALAALGRYRDPRRSANIARDHDAALAETYRS